MSELLRLRELLSKSSSQTKVFNSVSAGMLRVKNISEIIEFISTWFCCNFIIIVSVTTSVHWYSLFMFSARSLTVVWKYLIYQLSMLLYNLEHVLTLLYDVLCSIPVPSWSFSTKKWVLECVYIMAVKRLMLPSDFFFYLLNYQYIMRESELLNNCWNWSCKEWGSA